MSILKIITEHIQIQNPCQVFLRKKWEVFQEILSSDNNLLLV